MIAFVIGAMCGALALVVARWAVDGSYLERHRAVVSVLQQLAARPGLTGQELVAGSRGALQLESVYVVLARMEDLELIDSYPDPHPPEGLPPISRYRLARPRG